MNSRSYKWRTQIPVVIHVTDASEWGVWKDLSQYPLARMQDIWLHDWFPRTIVLVAPQSSHSSVAYLQLQMHIMFQPLDSSRREIRLLRILPGTWVDSIRLALDVVSLDAKPQYQALSYVWGSEADPKTVTLHDQPFQVTSNLYNALRRLRKSRVSVALWVDAVSINQKDDAERTQQVSIMNHIYENAFEVVIWLGDSLSDSLKGLERSPGLLEDGPRYVANHASIGNFGRREPFDNTETEAAAAFTILKLLGEPGHWDSKDIFAVNQEGQFVVTEIYHAAWQAFLGLMSCSWWSRMWIVQEFVLARDSQVVVGNVAVPGHLITDFYHNYISHLPSGCCCHLTVSWRMTSDLWGEMMNIRRADMGLNAIRNQHHDHGAHNGNRLTALLRKTLWMLRPKEATDPRDKICGVLGLFPGIGITPDYTSEAAKFFSYATEFFIRAEEGLMILAGPRMRRPDMPSWVPDLIGDPKDRYFHSTTRRINLCDRFRACGGLNLWYRRDGRYLELRGRKIGLVKTASQPFSEGHEAEGLLRWKREAGISDISPSDNLYPRGGSQGDAFWRTIIRDTILDFEEPDNDRRATSGDASCYEVFRNWLCATGHDEKTEIGHQHVNFSGFQDAFFVATIGQTFFITDSGLFGLGEGVQSGDEIWIFAGGRVPFLIRRGSSKTPGDGRYTLVGDCYVHGVMYGEGIHHDIDLQPVFLE